MVDPAYLSAIRESYDRVADDYVGIAPARFAADALGRGMLAAFADRPQACLLARRPTQGSGR
ncbi:hypothetical protein AB0M35_06550 [Micromonospora sp. NPDC051196]|uniref:hypothetical protein n=1 Tax=Micromonospora sp. NPDC051196 TaxID=3155281 RepID=UPI00343C065C